MYQTQDGPVAAQVPIFLVVALDRSAHAALDALAPGHVLLAQQPQVEAGAYATPGSKQMRQVQPLTARCGPRLEGCSLLWAGVSVQAVCPQRTAVYASAAAPA